MSLTEIGCGYLPLLRNAQGGKNSIFGPWTTCFSQGVPFFPCDYDVFATEAVCSSRRAPGKYPIEIQTQPCKDASGCKMGACLWHELLGSVNCTSSDQSPAFVLKRRGAKPVRW